MNNVIVTGANGFIGRNLIRKLSETECEIYAVDISHENTMLKNLKGVHLIDCSLENINDLKEILPPEKYDAFYHFAWAGTTGAARTNYVLQMNNAKYTCDAALLSKELHCKKFITTGTITEKIAENILQNTYKSENLIYGLSKLYAHNLLEIISKKYDINYIWAKLSNIYGGDNANGNLISYTVNEFKNNNIPTYGPCTQPYDFLYIDDVITALLLLGDSEKNSNEYFIGSGNPRLLKDYLNEVSNIFKKQIAVGDRPDDGLKYEWEWFDNSKLVSELNFKCQFTFSEGIKKIYGEVMNNDKNF